jgi:CDP-glucose 4,6-dehydratase
MKNNFWKNKSIFVTGHTGFKGSWLTLILKSFNANVHGYALNPLTKPNFFDGLKLGSFLNNDFREDILDYKKLVKAMIKAKPDILFHLAAQSSVLESYNKPASTVSTNVVGTVNVLEAIKKVKSIKSVIIVTTDKVYQNLEEGIAFKEDSKLGGHDIYSSSKAACEILTQSYINSFFFNSKCNVATVRSGNCIGGGDWTKDRIIKDCAESFSKNKPLIIRNPNSTRPWQHVIEPLFGYLKLAKKLYLSNNKSFVGSWNFGPNRKNLKVLDLANIGKKIFNSKSRIIISKKSKKLYESKYLALNSRKAMNKLQWKIMLSNQLSLEFTFDWFKNYYKNKNKTSLIDFSIKQIDEYKKVLLKKKIIM